MATKKKKQGLSIKFWTTKSFIDDALIFFIILCLFVLAYLFFFYESPEEICDDLCYYQSDSRMDYIQEEYVNWCVCKDGSEFQATSAG